MQVGRSAFVAIAGRGQRVDRIFTRVTLWAVASGCVWIAGAFVGGHARKLVWLAALGVDLLADSIGFYTPGMGRTTSVEWTIAGGQFAERCQAFIIIALGESIVVIGQALSVRQQVTAAAVAAFVTAFAGSVALWWVYFDRSAEEGAQIIAGSADPGAAGQHRVPPHPPGDGGRDHRHRRRRSGGAEPSRDRRPLEHELAGDRRGGPVPRRARAVQAGHLGRDLLAARRGHRRAAAPHAAGART